MKLALGRLHAGIGAVLYWVTNPLWVGGSLAFISTAAWSDNISRIGSGTFGDYFFKLVFIWISIGVAIVSMREASGSRTSAPSSASVVLGFFSVTVLIYAIEHGLHGYSFHQFGPSTAVFLGLVPLLLFNYVGFELQNGAAEEMINPQKDVPMSVRGAGIITVLAYARADLRDPRGAPGEQDLRHRRVPGRRPHDLQRVRRRPELHWST